jgi:hypothetical protein
MAAKVPQWVCERAEKCTPVKRDFYLCTIHDRVPKPKFQVEFLEEASAFLDSLDEKVRVFIAIGTNRKRQTKLFYI